MRIAKWLSAVLFAFILLPFVAVLFVSLTLWQDSSAWRAAASRGIAATAGMSDATTAAILLKQELDIYEKHASSLQQMLSILLGLSSLYAAVLGLGAYLGTRKILEEGEKYVSDLQDLKRDSQTKLSDMVTQSRTELDSLRGSSQTRLDGTMRQYVADLDALRTGSQSRLDGLARQYVADFGAMSRDSQARLQHIADVTAGSLSDIERKAEERLHQIATRADEQAGEFGRIIRREYPLFGSMDTGISRMMADLMRLLPDIDPTARHYHYLSQAERHQILFYEKGVAFFGFLNLREFRQEVSRIYRGLGNFYGSKFAEDKKTKAGDAEDLGRAKFYLDLAIETFSDNTGAWNDRGLLAMRMESDPAAAQQFFESSLKRDTGQQRARYNLAVLFGEQRVEGGYRRAIDLLTAAIGQQKWETGPNEARRLDLFYNRACYRTLLAGLAPAEMDRLLAEAFDDLQTAMSGYDAEREAAFKADCQPGGDLFLLVSAPLYAAEISKLRRPTA